MRLTLRTLLAYLDDTLEPAQAKEIGQKVAESEAAQELIARIKQVTRRRRLANPPPSGTTNIDPNTLAEYLENTLEPEQLDKVEQICLASDANLAELATCHQILTQIQTEQSLVSPTSRQRMYGLVKGREAIPFRKPPRPRAAEPEEEPLLESREEDETLRLGLPLLRRRGGWAQAAAMVGGSLALVAILALAIAQVLRSPATPTGRDTAVAAHKEKDDKKADTAKKPAEKEVVPDKKQGEEPVVPKVKKEDEKPIVEDKKNDGQPANPDKTLVTKPVDETPSGERLRAGEFVQPDASATSLLVQKRGERWERVANNRRDVFTAEPLLSLPGYRSRINLANGLRLTLWGHLPELYPEMPPVRESAVELHASKRFDLDLTLLRGRIALINTRPASAQVRVRFANPTNPEHKEFWDLTLADKGTEVLLEKSGVLPPESKFYANPKHSDRLGPLAAVALVVIEGHVRLKVDDNSFTMDKAPGHALFVWSSGSGTGSSPYRLEKLPDAFLRDPPYPKKYDPNTRKNMRQSLEAFSTTLTARPDVALVEATRAQDPNRRELAVNGLGALDDVGALLEALANDRFEDVRQAAIDELRFWLAQDRDHDQALYARARKRWGERPADILLSLLLFNYSPQALGRPDTYEEWINLLNNPLLPIRQAAAWHLYQVVPSGRDITFNAAANAAELSRAQQAWRKLIPRGQLPPAPPKK